MPQGLGEGLVEIHTFLQRASLHAQARLGGAVAFFFEHPHELVDATSARNTADLSMRCHDSLELWLPNSLSIAAGQGSPLDMASAYVSGAPTESARKPDCAVESMKPECTASKVACVLSSIPPRSIIDL